MAIECKFIVNQNGAKTDYRIKLRVTDEFDKKVIVPTVLLSLNQAAEIEEKINRLFFLKKRLDNIDKELLTLQAQARSFLESKEYIELTESG